MNTIPPHPPTVRRIWFMLSTSNKLQIATVILDMVIQMHQTIPKHRFCVFVGLLSSCLLDQGASHSLLLHHALRAALCALEIYSVRQLQCIPTVSIATPALDKRPWGWPTTWSRRSQFFTNHHKPFWEEVGWQLLCFFCYVWGRKCTPNSSNAIFGDK